MTPTEGMIDRLARTRFQRNRPMARAGDWDWLPAAAKRQWLEEAKEDLVVALEGE